MPEQVHNPIFARLWERVITPMSERRGADEHRRKLLDDLGGRVIEVGAGQGVNFSYYPTSVEHVVAIEPEDYLRARAHEAARHVAVPIRVVDAVADALPAADAEFDAAIASLVLCSVPDQERSLAELFRAVRPGGELRFYEHVLADSPRLARAQRTFQPIWTFFAGGCHPDRDTAAAIEAGGFRIERCRRFLFRAVILEHLAAPKILGVARRP